MSILLIARSAIGVTVAIAEVNIPANPLSLDAGNLIPICVNHRLLVTTFPVTTRLSVAHEAT